MRITKEKVASATVFLILAILALTYLGSLGIPGFALYVGLVISFFGLLLVWFAEPLSEIASFSRGIPLRSPPQMIELFGWLFLLGYPVLIALLLLVNTRSQP